MTVRNWKSQANAMLLRFYIANILSQYTQLDHPVSDKELCRRIGGGLAVRTAKRHRAWVRREYVKGTLPELYEWVKRARRGERPG